MKYCLFIVGILLLFIIGIGKANQINKVAHQLTYTQPTPYELQERQLREAEELNNQVKEIQYQLRSINDAIRSQK